MILNLQKEDEKTQCQIGEVIKKASQGKQEQDGEILRKLVEGCYAQNQEKKKLLVRQQLQELRGIVMDQTITINLDDMQDEYRKGSVIEVTDEGKYIFGFQLRCHRRERKVVSAGEAEQVEVVWTTYKASTVVLSRIDLKTSPILVTAPPAAGKTTFDKQL